MQRRIGPQEGVIPGRHFPGYRTPESLTFAQRRLIRVQATGGQISHANAFAERSIGIAKHHTVLTI